jgi:hypothetical protein
MEIAAFEVPLKRLREDPGIDTRYRKGVIDPLVAAPDLHALKGMYAGGLACDRSH